MSPYAYWTTTRRKYGPHAAASYRELWSVNSKTCSLDYGCDSHTCVRVLRKGRVPEIMRTTVFYCNAKAVFFTLLYSLAEQVYVISSPIIAEGITSFFCIL